MTTIAKDDQRIACHENIFVVINNGRIIKRIIIDDQMIRKEIDQVIDKREAPLKPYNIFRKAVENVTGYNYKQRQWRKIMKGTFKTWRQKKK